MKKNAFVVAEYNPFHNGHAYHLRQTKLAGAKNVICLMNGNFVQRGEPALFSKEARARCAVIGGADLVLEMPVKYGISSAAYFAYGGVGAAAATGLEGTLSFGASASAEQLRNLLQASSDPSFEEKVKSLSENEGCNYPTAFRTVLQNRAIELSNLLEDANNILGLEYLKAINSCGSGLDHYAVLRERTYLHDGMLPTGNIASARFIREKMISGDIEDSKDFIPDNIFGLLKEEMQRGQSTKQREYFDRSMMSYLSRLDAGDFSHINGVSQGLENRIAEAVKASASLETLYDSVKTKRFTHSRIRQILLSAYLGVTREQLDSGVNYLRVLAFNDRGRELLREMRKTAKVPVITNLSDIDDASSSEALRDKQTDHLAGKLFELCKTTPSDGNREFLLKPYFFSE